MLIALDRKRQRMQSIHKPVGMCKKQQGEVIAYVEENTILWRVRCMRLAADILARSYGRVVPSRRTSYGRVNHSHQIILKAQSSALTLHEILKLLDQEVKQQT